MASQCRSSHHLWNYTKGAFKSAEEYPQCTVLGHASYPHMRWKADCFTCAQTPELLPNTRTGKWKVLPSLPESEHCATCYGRTAFNTQQKTLKVCMLGLHACVSVREITASCNSSILQKLPSVICFQAQSLTYKHRGRCVIWVIGAPAFAILQSFEI